MAGYIGRVCSENTSVKMGNGIYITPGIYGAALLNALTRIGHLFYQLQGSFHSEHFYLATGQVLEFCYNKVLRGDVEFGGIVRWLLVAGICGIWK